MGFFRFFGSMLILLLAGCGKSDHKYQGYIEAENIYISSPYGGKLLELHATRGKLVEKGDLLFELDPNPEVMNLTESEALYQQGLATLDDLKKPKRQAEIDAIKAQIQQAEAQISLANIRVKRNQTLFDRHVLDKDTLDAAVEKANELAGLKAQLMANMDLALLGARPDVIIAQSAATESMLDRIKQFKWKVEQKHLSAPTAGVIFDTYYRPGEYVAGTSPVMSIVAPENTHVEFFVPLQALANLHLGKIIHFSDEDESERKRAKVVYISPEAEYMPPLVYSRDNSEKIVFRIKADVVSPARLIPGEPVVVSIEPDHD